MEVCDCRAYPKFGFLVCGKLKEASETELEQEKTKE